MLRSSCRHRFHVVLIIGIFIHVFIVWHIFICKCHVVYMLEHKGVYMQCSNYVKIVKMFPYRCQTYYMFFFFYTRVLTSTI